MCYHSKTEVGEHARQEVRFSFNQPVDKEPMFDFTLYQSETEQQFEEDVFRSFCNEEYEREGNVYLKLLNKHNDYFSPRFIQFNFSFLCRKVKIKDIS